MLIRNVLFSLSCFFIISCTPFAPEINNPEEVLPSPIPQYYNILELDSTAQKDTSSQKLATQSTNPWWETFKSTDLNTLEQTALGQNFDILTAWARLKQNAAIARKALGDRMPSLDLTASTIRSYQTSQEDRNALRTSTEADSYGMGFIASYELDLWGRVASAYEASDLRLEASNQDLHAAAVTVTAAVANTWADLLGNRAAVAVLKRQIKINKSLVQMQQVRFSNALASSIDVLQQREVLVASEAELPQFEQDAVTSRNRLAILLGKLPGTLPIIDENAPLPALGTVPDQGLPIQVLEMRPDIRAAWARLEAAHWDSSKAKAQRFPALQLSASQAFNSPTSSTLFLNWVTNLMADLTFPVFAGGSLAAEEARVRAVAEEAMQNYIKTVAVAIQEINDAIATDVAQQARLSLLQEQLVLALASAKGTLRTYLEGTDTFLRFVTQLKNTQNLERSVAQQQVTVINARITLYRVLGGLHLPLTSIPNLVLKR